MSKALIIYLHGFLSSPQAHKARLLGDYLAKQGGVAYRVPALEPLPETALAAARGSVKAARDEGYNGIGLVGSSMGGFYATVLAEQWGLPAVLVNPSVRPHRRLTAYYGPQTSLSSGRNSGRKVTLGPEHAAQLEAMAPAAPTRPERYWLLLQIGDEVLDYREAVHWYSGCRQTVEPGGGHQFEGFERHLPAIVKFLQ